MRKFNFNSIGNAAPALVLGLVWPWQSSPLIGILVVGLSLPVLILARREELRCTVSSAALGASALIFRSEQGSAGLFVLLALAAGVYALAGLGFWFRWRMSVRDERRERDERV